MSSDGTVQYYPNNAMTQEFNYQTSGIGAEHRGRRHPAQHDSSAGRERVPRHALRRRQSRTAGLATTSAATRSSRRSTSRRATAPQKIIEVNTSAGGPIKRDRPLVLRLVPLPGGRSDRRRHAISHRSGRSRANWWMPETWNGEPGISDQYHQERQPAPDIAAEPASQDHAVLRPHLQSAVARPRRGAGSGDRLEGQRPEASRSTTTLRRNGRRLSRTGFSSSPATRARSRTARPISSRESTRCAARRTGSRGPRIRTSSPAGRIGPRPTVCAGFFRRGTRLSTAVSYVTGSHSAKAGVQYVFGQEKNTTDYNADLVQRYRNGVPDSVTVRNTPTEAEERVNADIGVYVQDSWTQKAAHAQCSAFGWIT